MFLNIYHAQTGNDQGDDAVSSSSHVARFVNATVQTPNRLLRNACEEYGGGSSRKPSDREFKEFAEKLRAEFDQEKKRAVNVATRSVVVGCHQENLAQYTPCFIF